MKRSLYFYKPTDSKKSATSGCSSAPPSFFSSAGGVVICYLAYSKGANPGLLELAGTF